MGLWRGLVERWRALAVSARALSIAGAAVLVLSALVGLALPAYAARRLAERASGYGFSVELGTARLGWGRLWLRDLTIRDPKLPGSRVQLDAVALKPTLRSGLSVTVYGAQVELVGSEEQVSARVRELRGPERADKGSGGGKRRELAWRGVGVRWQRGGGRGAQVWGLNGRQSSDGSGECTADLVRFRGRGLGGDLRAIELAAVSQNGARRLARLEAAQVALRVELPAPSEDPPRAPGDEPRLEPKSASARKPNSALKPKNEPTPKGEATSNGEPTSKTESAFENESTPKGEATSKDEPMPTSEPQPDAAGWPASGSSALQWGALKDLFAKLTAPSFRASVVALSVETHRGEESLRVGPSRLALKREAQMAAVEIVPHASGGEAATALTIRARMPLDGRPAELDLSGGPVSLSTLGVREGDFGLVSVREARLEADAHLVIPFDGAALSISSKGALENVRLRRPALAPRELSGIRVGWRFDGKVSGGGADWAIQEAELSLGDVRVAVAGKVERQAARSAADLTVEVPLASCSALLAAVPRGMAPLLDGVRLEGTFALKGSLTYDSENPLATRTRLDVSNQCRVAEAPAAIAPRRFQNPWLREVKGADGLPMSIESGPGTPDWTPYEGISPFLETAVVVCEDGGFFSHHGIDYRAIENSLRQNLEAGRFLRGGSTVSMQLAKNLYLGKEKTLSRKLQEAVLTLLLEQQLSKHELMELYLNVIEFGPGIYGVRQAARYYFNEEPRALSLGQALYLGSILPSPDTQHFRPDGHVSEGWARYLRTLMQVARRIRRISEDELAAGLSEEVVFREPSLVAREAPAADEIGDDDDPEPPEPEP